MANTLPSLLIIVMSDLPTYTFIPILLPFHSILLLNILATYTFVVIYHMNIIARQEPVWRHVLDSSHLGLVSFARSKAKD